MEIPGCEMAAEINVGRERAAEINAPEQTSVVYYMPGVADGSACSALGETKCNVHSASRYAEATGLMCPRMTALGHPVAPLLKKYASQGCPVDGGRD